MSEKKFLSYIVSISFLVYFITTLRTPFGDRLIPYGYFIALASLVLMGLIAVFKSNIRIQQHSIPVLLIVSALFLFTITSTIWSQYPQLTFQRALMSFLGIASALIIGLTDRNKRYTFYLLSIMMFLLISSLSVSGVLIYFFGTETMINDATVQLLTVGSIEIIQNIVGSESRIASPLLANPNTLAGLIAISIPLSVHLLIRSKSFLVASGIAVQFIALILTFSRTGLVVTTVALMLLSVFFLYQQSKLRLMIKIVLLSLVPSLLFINYIPGISRLTSLSFTVRKMTWTALYESFTQNPLIGTGFGVSNEAVLFVTENTAASSHSDYFAMLAEQGVVGIVLFIFLLLSAFFVGLKTYINSNGSDRIYLAVAMAIFVSLSIRGLAETVMIRPGFTQLFWAYMFAFILSSDSIRTGVTYTSPNKKPISNKNSD